MGIEWKLGPYDGGVEDSSYHNSSVQLNKQSQKNGQDKIQKWLLVSYYIKFTEIKQWRLLI
jgi:hypothetical protein